MLRWVFIFAVLALIAAVFGMGNLAGDFSYIAWILLVVFIVLLVVSAVLGRRGGPPV